LRLGLTEINKYQRGQISVLQHKLRRILVPN